MTRTSTCVDCATPIIGDSLRCGPCNDRLDTVPEELPQAGAVLARWIVVVELLIAVVLGVVLATRSCAP